MRILATGLAILLCAASAAAQTVRKVPLQYDTIQAACDAADDGDTILVSKKADGSPYEEWVSTGKRLNFTGKGVTWDGHKLSGGSGTCLSIEAGSGGLTIQGFHFRNGIIHLSISANDVVVQKCTFRGAHDDSINLVGANAVVQKCVFRGNTIRAASIEGPGAIVRNNTATGNGGGGLYVYGNDAQIHKNKVVRSGGGSAVYVSGNHATVLGNTLSDGETGVYLEGDDGLIVKNKVSRFEGESTGIDAYGRGNRVLANTLTMIGGDGVYMSGSEGSSEDPIVVEGNKVRWIDGSGIYVYGYTAEVRKNAVQHVDGTGISCYWQTNDTDSVVEANRILDCFGDGIYVNGGGHEILGNDVKSVSESGIYCDGGNFSAANVIEGNKVAGYFDRGIASYAEDSAFQVEGNQVSDGMASAEGIYVWAPGSLSGSVQGNKVSGAGGRGVFVHAVSESTGFQVNFNAVDGSGTSWDEGFDLSFSGSMVQGNTVQDQVDSGFFVNGDGNTVDGNLVRGCLRMCIYVGGVGNTVTGNGGIGSDGEGFANFGTGTIFTGNTFLKNRLDVTNNGTFATADIEDVNTFVTGGASQVLQIWD